MVELPAVMWLAGERNHEARMMGWNLQMELDCGVGEAHGPAIEVSCNIPQVELDVSPHPADVGQMQPIVAELSQRLGQAEVRLRFGPDGRVRHVALVGPNQRNRRMTAMQENLRLMVSRAVAGLDLLVPEHNESIVKQKGGWLLQMPAGSGTLVGGGQQHLRTQRGQGWTVRTAGEATLEPHSSQEWPSTSGLAVDNMANPLPEFAWDSWPETLGVVARFETVLSAEALLDSSGLLVERSWMAIGDPSSGSRMSVGAEGYRYVQGGLLRRLDGEEQVVLGFSEEIAPPENAPSALQTESLGVGW
jgi:hypothetical protein